jgi:hypothetical protein
VFNAYHESVSALLPFSLLEFRVAVLDEEALVKVLEDIVEEGDHLDREVDELIVEFSVVVLKVRALHFKDGAFQQFKLV